MPDASRSSTPALVAPNPLQYRPVPRRFYCDETALTMEGKPHWLVASLLADYEPGLLSRWYELKAAIGAPFAEELKSSRKQSRSSRLELYEGLFSCLQGSTLLIAVAEGESKQPAVQLALRQVLKHAKSEDLDFEVHLDQGMIKSFSEVRNLLLSESPPFCIGLSLQDSAVCQMTQVCDLLAATFRIALESLDRKRNAVVHIPDYFGPGDDYRASLAHHVSLRARYLLPGKYVERVTTTAESEYMLPFNYTWGRGFILQSTVSKSLRKRIQQDLAKCYMGCTA